MRKAPAPYHARCIAADALAAGAEYVKLTINENEISVSFRLNTSEGEASWTRDNRGGWELGPCLVTVSGRIAGRTLNSIKTLI